MDQRSTHLITFAFQLSQIKRVALTATIFNFDIQVANVDRNVYESLALRVACHPSESEEYLLARVIAYALEYAEGIAFSKGISDPDDPTVSIRDLTGTIKTWIEIGAPDAARLHKASKASPRVVVYTHKDPAMFLRSLEGARIHRAEHIEVYAIDRELIAELVHTLDRRVKFDLSLNDGQLYVDINGRSLTGTLDRITIG